MRISTMDQLSNKRDISSLPPEVLENVFEFLTFKERLRASLTCKRWYQAAFSLKFRRSMQICIGKRRATFGDIRAYQNYRKAWIEADTIDGNQSAVAEFFRAAPLESLVICGNISSLRALLDEHLLSMSQLSTLEVVCVRGRGATIESVVKINHPSLNSLKVHYSGYATYQINCPNLTHIALKCITKSDCVKAVQLVIQLQQQLQSLHVTGLNEELGKLTNAKLSHLKNLKLFINRVSNGFKLRIYTMVHLVELILFSKISHIRVGEELSALIHLSKLKLIRITIETAGFEKALCKMELLEDLNLQKCEFTLSSKAWHITSANFRNLSMDWRGEPQLMPLLPCSAKLKSLKLLISNRNINDIFLQVCNSYPQLEKLHFSVTADSKFRTWTTISHIKQLTNLKELHLSGVFLKNLHWNEIKLEKVSLNSCEIAGVSPQQFIESFGPWLQQLRLIQCDDPFGTFKIDAKFVQLLRRGLPRCRICCEYVVFPAQNEERFDTIVVDLSEILFID